MTTPRATNLTELIDQFDVFFIDQYRRAPSRAEALRRRGRSARPHQGDGQAVVLLSNSGKRSALNAERLGALGFPRDSWDLFVSSGEVAWRMLSSGGLSFPRRSDGPLRCLLFERGGDSSAIAGLGFEIVDDSAAADLVVIAGSDGDRMMLADYEKRIAPAAARKIPAICTNPDKAMLTAGGPCFGPGLIAELYEALGGHVTWIGKPFPDIYRVAMEGIGAAPSRPHSVHRRQCRARHCRRARRRPQVGAGPFGHPRRSLSASAHRPLYALWRDARFCPSGLFPRLSRGRACPNETGAAPESSAHAIARILESGRGLRCHQPLGVGLASAASAARPSDLSGDELSRCSADTSVDSITSRTCAASRPEQRGSRLRLRRVDQVGDAEHAVVGPHRRARPALVRAPNGAAAASTSA